MQRLLTRIRREEGFQLVEMLIALTILAVGITAVVAGFSSAMVANIRSGRASTAAVIADQKMEQFRRIGFDATPSFDIGTTSGTQTGPDSRTYWTQSVVSWACPLGGSPSGSPLTCPTVSGASSRPVKLVAITVRDGSSAGRVLFSESSTFDRATGS